MTYSIQYLYGRTWHEANRFKDEQIAIDKALLVKCMFPTVRVVHDPDNALGVPVSKEV